VMCQSVAGQMPRTAGSNFVLVSPRHCRPWRTDICSAEAARSRLLCVIDEAAGKYYDNCIT